MMTKALSALAAIMFVTSIVHVLARRQPWSMPDDTFAQPYISPYEHSVCGSGVVEPAGEIVEVGPATAGPVAVVYVSAGSRVKAGDPLLKIEDSHLQAERARRLAAVERSRAELERLEQPPRSGVLAVSQSAIATARVDRDRAMDTLDRKAALYERAAAPPEELRDARYRLDAAQSQLDKAQAEYDLLRSGTWEPDLAVARAAVHEAEAGLSQIDVEIERAIVRAPMAADVLQISVHAGEYVSTPAARPPVILGDQSNLFVRAEIDEYDLGRFSPASPAVAVAKGDPRSSFRLAFVRIEPLVVAKQSLTGAGTERVDTRVLHVIYRLVDPQDRLFVGQQVYVCAQGSAASVEPQAGVDGAVTTSHPGPAPQSVAHAANPD